jgi:hypothetical protein
MNKSTLVRLFFSGLVVSSLAVNVIIDDANSSWTFSGSWNAITPTDPCDTCTITPNASMAFNHTWHETSTSGSSAQIRFNGVSIQVYTVLPPGNNAAEFSTNLSFTLDDIGDGFFVGPYPVSTYMYNYLVYARTNLTDGFHVVGITNNPSVFTNFSALLIDYAIYDDGTSAPAPTETPTSTQASLEGTHFHSSVPTGAIVATSVIAALLFIANLAQLFLYRRSKKLQSHVGGVAGDGTSPTAYPLTI